uniref:Uncharacterized protein n=1 Tax=Branchiostoma floridae TaxID=7739 RepID=C3ZFH0_BRAFL|eukprot:XP_002592713.1 hypothetical protein BRAFLDRAFT_67153 [Branchiostoma floridae]
MPRGQQQSQTGDTDATGAPTQQPQTDWRSIADAAACIPNALYVSRADRTYPGGVSSRGAIGSFIRSHKSSMAASIAVLLSLAAVGLTPLTFINKEEITQLSTTVDALKSTQNEMDQLSPAIDALKRNQDDISTTVEALKRDLDGIHQLSSTVEALRRDQDDMRQLSTSVDALKRGQDNIRELSTSVEALKRDQDDMRQLYASVDALESKLYALNQKLVRVYYCVSRSSCPTL